jgi:hypothetical protein
VLSCGFGFSVGGLSEGDQDAGDTAKIRRVTPHTPYTYRTLTSALAVMEGSAQANTSFPRFRRLVGIKARV